GTRRNAVRGALSQPLPVHASLPHLAIRAPPSAAEAALPFAVSPGFPRAGGVPEACGSVGARRSETERFWRQQAGVRRARTMLWPSWILVAILVASQFIVPLLNTI